MVLRARVGNYRAIRLGFAEDNLVAKLAIHEPSELQVIGQDEIGQRGQVALLHLLGFGRLVQ